MLRAKRLVAIPGGGGASASPEVTEISDSQIIEGLAGGHAWAADAFYDRVATVVDRTLRRILQSQEADYEDLQQVTLERIVQSLIDQRFSGACSLATWASAIASHVGIDAVRSKIRNRNLFREGHDADSPDAPEGHKVSLERRLEARSEIEQLQQVLATMKPEHAETLFLHDALGHELSEIAVLTGVSVAAAQSRLVRGRKELLRRARVRSMGRDA